MSYSKRIETLCSLLTEVNVFADVGCDHGYCSEYMLKNGLCNKAILSDISKGSLQKAETLLDSYIKNGKAVSVLGNGFFGVPADVDLVLIAGMGGSEIVEILSDKKYGFMPKRFVFQPMHDSEKLRRYIFENGGNIEKDFTFSDVKYYDVLCGGKAKDEGQVRVYSDLDYEFGKDNLETFPLAFLDKIEKQIKNIQQYLFQTGLQEESRRDLENRKNKLQGVVNRATQ